MTTTKSKLLVNLVRKQIAGGYEKRETIPTPQSRFEKLGTIFSRTTGLIKSGVISPNEIPMWYSLYQAFPPKYEPKFKRVPLNVEVKHIYYPEDKQRAAAKKWTPIHLHGTTPVSSVESGEQRAPVPDLIAEAAKV